MEREGLAEKPPERGIGGKLLAKLARKRGKRVWRQRDREEEEENRGLARFHGESGALEW